MAFEPNLLDPRAAASDERKERRRCALEQQVHYPSSASQRFSALVPMGACAVRASVRCAQSTPVYVPLLMRDRGSETATQRGGRTLARGQLGRIFDNLECALEAARRDGEPAN